MITLPFRKPARLAMLACAGVLLFANSALADYHQVSGTHGFGQVAGQCGGAGGKFWVETDGSYGCILTDSNGAVSSAECTAKGSCVCQGPQCAAVVKGRIKGLRPPASAGTASAAGGAASKKRPLRNVNQPVVVQHSGGAHSGGSKH